MTKKAIPGVTRPIDIDKYDWKPASNRGKKSIEDRRQSVIAAIDRSLSGVKGSPRLEQQTPDGKIMVRVLYAGSLLPVFDGRPLAEIDPLCDRAELWQAIRDEIRSGACDAAIEESARKVSQSLDRKRAMLKAV